MFSLNALDPKLVWHIEKETKGGMEEGRPEWTEKLREKRNIETVRKMERGGDTERKARKTKKHTHKTKPPQIKIKIEEQMNSGAQGKE